MSQGQTILSRLRDAVFMRRSRPPNNTRGNSLFGRFASFLPTSARQEVTPYTAVMVPPLLSGILAIVDPLSSSRWNMLVRNSDDDYEPFDTPIDYIVNDAPNPEMNGFEFKQVMLAQMLLSDEGESYAEIVRSQDGRRVLELWPIPSYRMERRRDEQDRLYYRDHNLGRGPVDYWPDELLIFRGRNLFGDCPSSLIQLAREAIAGALATQEFGNRFFSNGANLGGFLETDQKIPADVRAEMEAAFAATYAGTREAHGVMMLPHGIKFHRSGIEPDKAQMLAVQKFFVVQIARVLRLPPHVVMELERSTNNNIAHQGIEYVHALIPHAEVAAQEVSRKLLPGRRSKCRVDLDWLKEGDAQQMAEADSRAVASGVWTMNERRKRHGLKRVKGVGDQHFMQSGMRTVEWIASAKHEPTSQEQADASGAGGNGLAGHGNQPPGEGT